MATTSLKHLQYQIVPSQPQENGCCTAIILYARSFNSFVAKGNNDSDTQL
jgi:hypothetical protein